MRRALDHSFLDLRARVVVLAFASGLAGGLVGALYLLVLHVLEHYLWPAGRSAALNAAVLVAVGLVVGVLVRVLGSPGDVELMVDNVHVSGTATDVRTLRSLLPTSWLCIAAGGAMGPEAPLVQTTGTLAAHAAQRAYVTVRESRVVTISGMAAGFAVLFGAPLGAAVFALEMLHRRGLQYYEALLPAVVGALAGYSVHAVATGVGLAPVWHLPAPASLRVGDLGWAAALGVGGALVGALFVVLCRTLRGAARRIPPTFRPLAGGILLGLLGAASTWSLTFGEDQLGVILASPSATIGVFLAAAVAKLAATSVTWASEWRGGFIIPLFFIGAALGQALHVAVPGTGKAVVVAALMAACVAGVTRTPVGSALVVSGMFGMQLLPTTLVAGVVAFVLVGDLGLIPTQRERAAASG